MRPAINVSGALLHHIMEQPPQRNLGEILADLLNRTSWPKLVFWALIALGSSAVVEKAFTSLFDQLLAERRAKLELKQIEAKEHKDSLQYVQELENQRIKSTAEAEAAVMNYALTDQIADELVDRVNADYVHIIKLHNTSKLEKGEAIEMSLYSEGVALGKTSMFKQLQKIIAPPGFVRHYALVLGKDSPNPWTRFRYVPDVSKDSTALLGPISLLLLQEMGTSSVLTFWVSTTAKGEIYLLTVSWKEVHALAGYGSPVFADTRRAAIELASLLK